MANAHAPGSSLLSPPLLRALLLSALVGGCGAGRASPAAMELNDRAALALASGDLERAEAGLRLALEHDPGAAPSLANLGLVALARGELREAERLLRAATSRDPDLVEAWSCLGVVLARLGDDGEARRVLEHALSIHPGRPEPRLELARLLVRTGGMPEARAHLLRLVVLRPEDAEALGLLALVELRLERPLAAGALVDEALARDPAAPAARLVQALLRARRGELDEAISALEELVEDPVVGREARVRLAAAELLSGRRERARTRVEALLDEDPFDPAVRLVAGAVALGSGDLVAARAHAREARTLEPGLAAAWLLEAECCARGEERACADEALSRARALAATPAHATDALGRELSRVAGLLR